MKPPGPPDQDLPDAVAGLWGRITALAEGLDPDDWQRPTPCTEWSVKDLLAHLSGLQVGFDGTAPEHDDPAQHETPAHAGELDAWVTARSETRRDWSPGQVLAELRLAARGHVARLRAVHDWQAPARGPLGPTNERLLAAVRCFDLWVHLQDLREALGLAIEDHDPSPAALVAYGYTVGLVPWLLAKRAAAPEGTALRLRLDPPVALDTVVAVRGGRGVFQPDADASDGTVQGDPAAFVLLLSGRRDPQRWRQAGLLRWEGDVAGAFVRRARIL